ncbi:MAG TPA: dienelactone hydrolase family protein [Ignavibacteria bacterium]|jgi:carboxymethylenebutenolidase
MKTFIFSILCLFLAMNNSYSQGKSCCEESSATEIMASFGDDENFRNLHPEPLPFQLTDGKGQMVTFKVKDGADGNAYEVKASIPTNNWVLVFHEWYGLNDYIKKESEEIASTLGNVNVLAVDLYDGKVATNNEEASKYVKEVDKTRAINIINGAKDYAGSTASFATIGWCFGGAWSNQAAIELGPSCKACVIYYGMPEQNLERLAKLKAPVLGIFALKDQNITPEIVAKFEENLKSLNIPVEIHSYDAVHAFANPSNPKHDPDATKDAKEKTYAFLKDKLK